MLLWPKRKAVRGTTLWSIKRCRRMIDKLLGLVPNALMRWLANQSNSQGNMFAHGEARVQFIVTKFVHSPSS